MGNVTARYAFTLLAFLASDMVLSGCVSFQVLKRVEGQELVSPGDELQPGRTTIGDVLSLLGAPDKLAELEGKDLLVYERVVVRNNRLSLGLSVTDIWGLRTDVTGYGALTRYDTLACFFTPDGVLQDMVFERDSDQPYFKTLFTED